MRQENPLNLSILISGGKETNKDSPSNSEWRGKSSSLKSVSQAVDRVVSSRRVASGDPGLSPLEKGIREGENPVCDLELTKAPRTAYVFQRVELFGTCSSN